MNSVTEDFERQAVLLPITEAARHRADHFAQGQYNLSKAESVRLNTLAVWVTNDYLQMMGISTDLENSDSWKPVMQVMADVADLLLPEVGRLECRPIQGDGSVCYVPPEAWDLRVGYVVVAVAENRQTAKLLGFTPTVDSEELPLTKLEPIENLFDHLNELRQVNAPMAAETAPGVGPLPGAV